MFTTLGLPAPLLQALRAAGLTDPTAIQSKAIPVILQGNDLIGNAPSGSGKTGAFMLPSFARLLDGGPKLRAIVLEPTPQHAIQVEAQARDFSRGTDLRVGTAHSGSPLASQERMLREPGVDVLIATVDRLLELDARRAVEFEDIEIFVLDDADRMVDMGQAPEIRKLLKLLPETRQTLLFSATMPAELNRLGKEALIEPVRVDLTSPQPAAGITHAIYPVLMHLKIELLDRLLSSSGEVRSTIVFARQREGADRLARQLERRGYAVATLHERKNQTERERAMDDLRRGRLQIVVTTDQSARGLDLGGVVHVVNFDVPPSPEDYQQRIMRTGRPDAQGDAFTLMAPEEQRHLAGIERFIGRAIPRVRLPDFKYERKPQDIAQAPIYDDEHIRARRSAASRNPYLAGRMPGSNSTSRFSTPRPAVSRSGVGKVTAARPTSGKSAGPKGGTAKSPAPKAAAVKSPPARPVPNKPVVPAKAKAAVAKPAARTRPASKGKAAAAVKPATKPKAPAHKK